MDLKKEAAREYVEDGISYRVLLAADWRFEGDREFTFVSKYKATKKK